MSKLVAMAIAAAFGFTVNGVMAQNVKSDQDKAQGQERVMENKEKGAGGAGDRNESKETQAAPSQDDAKTAMKCKGMSGHEKEECMEHEGRHHEGTASEEHHEDKDEHHQRKQ